MNGVNGHNGGGEVGGGGDGSGSQAYTNTLHYLNLLYGGHADATQRRAADEWLKEFRTSSEAWSVAPALLENATGGEPAHFYGASVLDAKIVDQFADLPLESHAELRDALFRYIERFSGASTSDSNVVASTAHGVPSVRNKLCRALAALAVQMVSWHDALLSDVVARLSAPHLVHAQLLVLTELPVECRNRHLYVALHHRQLLQSRLSAAAPQLISHLTDLLTAANGVAPVQAAVFDCLGTILRECNVPLSTLVGNPLVHAPFAALAQPDLFDSAVELICDLLRLSGERLRQLDWSGGASGGGGGVDDDDGDDGGPDSLGNSSGGPGGAAVERAGAQALASALLPEVIALKDAFGTDAVDKEDHEVFKAYTRIFAETGEYYARQFVAAGTPEALSLVSVLLHCAAHESVEVFAVTSNFWAYLAGAIHDDDARRAVFAPAYAQLLVVVRGHMRYDPNYEQWSREQLSDFDELRRRGMSDALRGCAMVLGAEAALNAACDAIEATLTAQAPWTEIEAALFAVRALAREVERREHAAVDAVALRALSLVLRLNEQHPKVMYTSLLIIGRYASFLSSEAGREFLAPVMNTITASLQRPETLGAAAVALNNVCQDCAKLLVEARESLLALYQHVAAQGGLSLSDAIEIVEAIARVVRHVEDGDARRASMQQLCLPLIRVVENPETPSKPFEFAMKLLAAAFKNAAIGRRTPPRSAGSALLVGGGADDAAVADPLFDLFVQLWPLISRVLGERLHDDEALNACSKLLRDTARELPAHQVATLTPDLFRRLAECFGQRPNAELVHIASSIVHSVDRAATLLEPLADLLQAAFECMQSVEAMQAFPDIVTENFLLALALLWSSPLPFAQSQLADAFVGAGVVGLLCENPSVTHAVATFFRELLVVAVPPSPNLSARAAATIDMALAQQLSSALMAALGRHVPALFGAIVKGLAGSLPLSHCHSIAQILRRLRRLDPNATHAALVTVLQNSLSNLDASHKDAFATAYLHADGELFDACEAFAHACRQRKRWMP
jgi:transportin-3